MERELHESADYERVVLWFEHDTTYQLSLIHLLGHYAIHRRPPRLELINIGDFPGARRVTGLGELPPEALRMLWTSRKPVSAAQLQLGLNSWRALTNPDPRPLAAIMRGDTSALPFLARALHRHLREPPSAFNGLSLTEELALNLMSKPFPELTVVPLLEWDGVVNLSRVFWTMHWVTDPLPGEGDGHRLKRVLAMEAASAPVFTRSPGVDHEGKSHPPGTDVVAITGSEALRSPRATQTGAGTNRFGTPCEGDRPLSSPQ